MSESTREVLAPANIPDYASQRNYCKRKYRGGVLKPVGEWWAGVRLVLPLALAIGALGVAFGYLARSAGMPVGAAVAMSAITFAGSPQFAALAVFAAGGTLLAAVAAA